ncbi:YqgQ family protein [Exiguobacterium flavidum]|uniref:YqgQ family protein n=1 Tax=Exiguobacterium flavidum TaxID=2184695 RepID=UPI000DF855A3|nr:YqgQ family protein [Exiguobacterium flavidum]
MKTMYDVQQLLKSYGTIVYLGDREADLSMMMLELDELEEAGVLEKKTYDSAKLILVHELNKTRNS